MAVSQKQIAESLGVSITLVSRVLSGKAHEVGIAEATVERVLKAADEMGYVPSAAALTLKGKSTSTIGVVVYDFKDPFFGAMIEELQEQAHRHAYSLVLTGFRKRIPEPEDLAPLHKHAIDGLILLGSDERAAWLDEFNGMSVARIGHGSCDEQSVRIAIDEDDAADQLLQYLSSTGYRNLVFLRENFPAHRLRYASLEKEAEKHGCRVRCVQSASWAYAAGFDETKRILESGSEEAVVCATDKIAMGALHAMHEAGRWLPVTGFDDIPAAAQFLPPITTVRQPIGEIARQAFDAVVKPIEPSEVLLKGTLMVRSSA